MIIIIPLGGSGERFKKKGYVEPKGLINVFNKKIIFYILESINYENIDFIYIPYNKEYTKYNFENIITQHFPSYKFKFYQLPQKTRGAAETIYISLDMINYLEDKPILCLDSDAFYENKDIVKIWNGENCIFTFNDNGNKPIYSYVKLDENEIIIDIKEKNKISNLACSGGYGFSSFKNLLKYSKFIIDNNITQKNEFYTSGVIFEMIKNKIKFGVKIFDKKSFFTLGTPVEVEAYYNSTIIKRLENKIKINTLIEGHSNFGVEILNINNTYYICKYSRNIEDSNRLSKQIEKQILHSKLFKFKIPKIIYSSNIINEKQYFLMEYMNKHIDILTYISTNISTYIDNLYNSVKNIIDKYIDNCIYKKINSDMLKNKIISVKSNINNISKILTKNDNYILDSVFKFIDNNIEAVCNIDIPLGFCHGDLTLSNILIDNTTGELCLIDFLDSFIESPLMDIVKIRQDTKFYWTLMLYNVNVDKTKIKIVMKRLDELINKNYSNYLFYREVYTFFEILNILRILQYCKKSNIKIFLINCLKEILIIN